MNANNLIERINNIKSAFKEEFGNLPEEKLNYKTDAESWSIAQITDHLIKVTESYYPAFNKLRTGNYKTPFMGKFNFIAGFFGKFILKSVAADSKRKVKTFTVWEADSVNFHTDVINNFCSQQEELKSYISELKDLAEKGTVISSPANDKIVYKLETAFDIIVSHQERHLEQARNVLNSISQ